MTKTKYGVKYLPFEKYYPDFFTDLENESIEWIAPAHIQDSLKTFLVLCARIKFKNFCYLCCRYPNATVGDYLTFIDIDGGKQSLLVSIVTDKNHYPNSALRIQKLIEELFLFELPEDKLSSIRLKIVGQLYPDESCRL